MDVHCESKVFRSFYLCPLVLLLGARPSFLSPLGRSTILVLISLSLPPFLFFFFFFFFFSGVRVYFGRYYYSTAWLEQDWAAVEKCSYGTNSVQ